MAEAPISTSRPLSAPAGTLPVIRSMKLKRGTLAGSIEPSMGKP
jgi:hypothetical protein